LICKFVFSLHDLWNKGDLMQVTDWNLTLSNKMLDINDLIIVNPQREPGELLLIAFINLWP